MQLSDLIITILTLVALPVFATQTRVIMARYAKSRSVRIEQVREAILTELPRDLAVVGMTLGIASFAFHVKGVALPEVNWSFIAFLFAAMASMTLLAFIPLYQSNRIRLVIGLAAYIIGMSSFVLGLLETYVGPH